MQANELEQRFDDQAAGYDERWASLSAMRDCLHLLVAAVLGSLPEQAEILCVGAGTGIEVADMAKRFPKWEFTVVEPSEKMLAVCKDRAQRESFAERCTFHHGYVDDMPRGSTHADNAFDAATCFLVSQFLLDTTQRTGFYQAIGQRLKNGGTLVCSDLTQDMQSPAYAELFEMWLRLMAQGDVSPAMRENMSQAYGRDVAILPAEQIDALATAAGFDTPIAFYQAGLIRGWFAKWPG